MQNSERARALLCATVFEKSPLRWAVERGCNQNMPVLLKAGAPLYCAGSLSRCPLFCIAACSQPDYEDGILLLTDGGGGGASPNDIAKTHCGYGGCIRPECDRATRFVGECLLRMDRRIRRCRAVLCIALMAVKRINSQLYRHLLAPMWKRMWHELRYDECWEE
jgi:hypothetical protein